ncbi:hypothetical protein MCW82_31575, partial [Azospirillum doebereinerae]|uniref:hypothetical protein n=1 Tax=Azospirillum doebereinerae TaxID=92933 RepID=UPI001EE57F4A
MIDGYWLSRLLEWSSLPVSLPLRPFEELLPPVKDAGECPEFRARRGGLSIRRSSPLRTARR